MNVWIRDDAGRVLGPIGLGVLRDLVAAGRIARIQSASRDGEQFVPLREVPEIADLVASEARRADDKMEADRIASLLHEMRGRPAHEVFELPESASLDEFKSAFFRLAKQYHPQRLPADALPELRLAFDALFHFLATTMAQVEMRLAPKPAAKSAGAASTPSGGRPAATATGGVAAPGRYGAESFVGLVQRPDGQPAVHVKVVPASIGMFVDNPLVNLAKDGVFLPTQGGLPLGSLVEMTFEIEGAARTVSARGRVVFENVGGRSGKPGIGLKFVRLADGDRAFLAEYVKRVQDAKR